MALGGNQRKLGCGSAPLSADVIWFIKIVL